MVIFGHVLASGPKLLRRQVPQTWYRNRAISY